MRVLGDGYAREEFRRHLDSTSMTNDRWIEFASEWSRYSANVAPKEEGAGPKFTGELSKETIDAMSEEQRMMLRKLKEEAQSFGRSRQGGRGDKVGCESPRARVGRERLEHHTDSTIYP